MDKLISEWISIQNVVVEKSYNKMMVEELGFDNEVDVCTFISIEKCEKTKEYCVIQNNKCISSSRLKKMHAKKTQIISRSTGEKFEVIFSKQLDTVETMVASIQMYYVVLRSIKTGHIYVLFSSGIVLKASDFIENPKVKDGLIDLIIFLKRYLLENHNKKIILGGHSMGAILALYSGYLFKKHDSTLFHSNVVVLGSGIAKSVSDDMLVEMSNLPNIKMFISGEVRKTKTTNKILYDCLQDKGDMNMYTPLNYIYKELVDDTFSYRVTPKSELTFKLEIGNENQCKKVHMWSYYVSLLEQLYNYKQLHTSRTKSIRKSKTKTLRNYIKSSTPTPTKNGSSI